MAAARTSPIWMLSQEELVSFIEDSESISDLLRKIGLSAETGGNHRTLKIRCDEEGLDLSGLKIKAREARSRKLKAGRPVARPLSEIMVAESDYVTTSDLKERLIREGVLENRCVKCGVEREWMGEPLVLILDHINGKSRDHRRDNLRLLCPNCNSQTSTFSGRNKARKPLPTCISCGKDLAKGSKATYCRKCVPRKTKTDRPTAEDLKTMMSSMSWVSIGRKYGVSDNAVKKWARRYGLLEGGDIMT